MNVGTRAQGEQGPDLRTFCRLAAVVQRALCRHPTRMLQSSLSRASVRCRSSLLGVVLATAACTTSPTPKAMADAAIGNHPDAEGTPTGCPSGQEHFEPGCSTELNLLQSGCYQRCQAGDDEICAAGTVCTPADINPCICPGQSECCDACGQRLWLCEAPPAVTDCGDQTRDAVLVGASKAFGECQGDCRFELTLSKGTRCDRADLVISAYGVGDPSRTNHGVLTPVGHAAIRERVAELGDSLLQETYGCPDCADGGASGVTVMRGDQTTATLYEYGNPPPVLAPLDELAQAIIYALQTCQSNNVVDVLDCSSPEAQ